MSLELIRASNGNGESVRSIVTGLRSVGSTTLSVDSLTNWPTNFIATSGTLLSDGTLDPATVTVFEGHKNVSQIVIDGFAPGYSDLGNTVGQVVVVKPTTHWADTLGDLIEEIQGRWSPTGTINQFAGASAPTGWLLCDGTAVSRTTYADLFAIIGTTYGSGDGSTTFTLPNLKGRVAVGMDAAQTEFDTLGETGGAKTHTLTAAEMPSHTHTLPTAHATGANDLLSGRISGENTGGTGATSANVNYVTSSAGSGDAHNNLQPYIVLNHIIKT